jgi:hypothetical protein
VIPGKVSLALHLLVLSPSLSDGKQHIAGQLDSTAFHDSPSHITACFATHCSQRTQRPIRQILLNQTLDILLTHPSDLLPKFDHKTPDAPNCASKLRVHRPLNYGKPYE